MHPTTPDACRLGGSACGTEPPHLRLPDQHDRSPDACERTLLPVCKLRELRAAQDFLTSAFLLTSKDTWLTRAQAGLLVAFMGDAADRVQLPFPAMVKPVELWTGKQVFGMLLRPSGGVRCAHGKPARKQHAWALLAMARPAGLWTGKQVFGMLLRPSGGVGCVAGSRACRPHGWRLLWPCLGQQSWGWAHRGSACCCAPWAAPDVVRWSTHAACSCGLSLAMDEAGTGKPVSGVLYCPWR